MHVNFNHAKVWIRILGLPVGFLTNAWTRHLLSQFGVVEDVEHVYDAFPLEPELRARVLIDLTRPLVPGCYLPLFNNRVGWVFFCYEGIHRSCKDCGRVGHSTNACDLSRFEANLLIQLRMEPVERGGLGVLDGLNDSPSFTNFIEVSHLVFTFEIHVMISLCCSFRSL